MEFALSENGDAEASDASRLVGMKGDSREGSADGPGKSRENKKKKEEYAESGPNNWKVTKITGTVSTSERYPVDEVSLALPRNPSEGRIPIFLTNRIDHSQLSAPFSTLFKHHIPSGTLSSHKIPSIAPEQKSTSEEDSPPAEDSEASNHFPSPFQRATAGNMDQHEQKTTARNVDSNVIEEESPTVHSTEILTGLALLNQGDGAYQGNMQFDTNHDLASQSSSNYMSDGQIEREMIKNLGAGDETNLLEYEAGRNTEGFPQLSRQNDKFAERNMTPDFSGGDPAWSRAGENTGMVVMSDEYMAGQNLTAYDQSDEQGITSNYFMDDSARSGASQIAAAMDSIFAGNQTQCTENATARFQHISTQTYEFDDGPDGYPDDQETFYETSGIEDLMSEVEVEEFIPWFDRNNNTDDNKSDTSELPEPENFRENHWSLEKSRGIRLGTFGCYYEGAIDNKKMHGHGRLILRDRDQFLEGKWDSSRLIELNFTQLTHDSRNQIIFIVKQKNTYLVTIREEKFVARATSSSFTDLNLAAPIAVIKSSLFKKFTIVDIIEDEVRLQRDTALKQFESSLKETASEDADPVNRAAILILLSRHSKQKDAGKVLSAIAKDECVSDSLRTSARNLLAIENVFLDRKLDVFKISREIQEQRILDLRGIIHKVYSERIAEHRQMLINKCPYALLSMLSAVESLPAEKILYITKEDVGIFEHLVSLANSEHYGEFFEWLLDGFKNKLRSIEAHTPPSKVIPVMFPVYGFLFKSFLEIISDISSASSGSDFADMLKSKSGKWRLKENIKWPDDQDDQTKKQKILNFLKISKKKITLSRKSLEVQYRFIFKMLMHFSPENYDKAQKYEYSFSVLEKDKNSTWWQKGLTMVREVVGWDKRLKDSPDERLVWLYILDHTVHELFKDDCQNQQNNENIDIVNLYAPLLQGHKSFVAKSKSNSYESFRVLTHSILRFIVSTAPYFKDAQDKPGIDVEILGLQIETITKASDEMDQDQSTFVSFKDLIAEFNRYWGLRLFIAVDNTSGFFSNRITEVMKQFMNIVTISLKKTVSIPVLVEYFRSFNDFFDDFKDIDFASWFVKSDFYDSEAMERVGNKLSSGVNCSYRVVDIDKYIKVLGSRPLPKHYILLIMSELLECIEKCLELAGHTEATHYVQVRSTGMLLDAIRRSLMYLKDQPDYVDFETFRKESIDPFKRIVTDNVTLSEFKKRTDIIKESFWYIRKMDELGIEQALQKLKSVNSCHISNELLDCYNLYLSKYNIYISNYNSLLRERKSHLESLEKVRQSIERPETVHFTKWTKQFKTNEIPRLLAGLSAIWSILVSKDVSSTGKFLKPHCIQILCVMRLLSVQEPEGASNHLAQVLTGQGKSVILGLLSSTLALTGHKVRVLCYSDYLSSRDQNDFEEFFKIFQVNDQICYGTFEDMANGFLNPKCDGKNTSLRKLVEDRVLSRTEGSLGSVTPESKDTVLLIDEVDVFFTEKFYGNVYSSCTIPKITGLGEVQEKMWSIAKGSKYEATEVVRLTEKFIDDEVKSGNLACRGFNAFRYKPRQRPLTLLVEDPDGNLQLKEYSNLSLMEEHLLIMAKKALLIGNGKENDWFISKFRIDENGRICMRNTAGKYVTNSLSSYLNTFNYFRLKGSNYENQIFDNYGYLLLDTGKISYARLPSQFKLILGVSGTLKDLSDYEDTGIKSYNINNFSILPSFFGESNLEFDSGSDFLCVNKEPDWLKTIYDKANQIVKAFRAVLIFFDTETQLNLFSKEYKIKFDRFNEITENTKEVIRDAYVNEAGLSSAVTLATRGMGRGVDYKSSLAVEKKDGIHVIQTFYSVDVKEEIQIKGRTARKDNKGSYELVLCKEHLIAEHIIKQEDSNSLSYSSLHGIRTELMNQKGKSHSEMIAKSERNHTITMDYYGLS